MITTTVPTHLRRLLAAISALLAGATAILVLAAPAHAGGNRHQVTIEKYSYVPSSLAVTAGDTVTWTNKDAVEHDVTVTSGPASFKSPMLAQGASWSHTFTVAGPYSYVCSVHPDMRATITVTAPPPAAASGPAPTTGSTPRPGTAAASPLPGRAPHRAATSPAPSTPRPADATSAPLAVPATQVVAAPASAATLQPLLLVVGASVAVILFCLLLLASRPELVALESDGELSRPRHLEEG